jgi:1-phosphatidylinositol-3-phosphate 5-kinase
MLNPHDTLKSELKIPRVDYEVKIFFPKKFEALRRFYCGSQYDFIESLIRTQEWTTVTGGKTKSKFYRSFDDKYVFKEIKKSEFKMFIEFAPSYFDYLCKSFFHNYPCALCKILGAFKIKVTTYKGGTQKITKKHIYITENLNFGIKPEDEPHIIRYDLKGSTLNRFVKKQVGTAPTDLSRVVLHDNNFQLAFMGRPLPIRYTINRILHICINNDTLCLSKSNIVDYSLLTIIDARRKKVRFGIIDYVQQYTLDKIFEGQFKRIINRGEVPTIVDPDKYKMRFKRAMKRYFIGMVTQEEKAAAGGAEGGPACSNKQEQLEMLLQ